MPILKRNPAPAHGFTKPVELTINASSGWPTDRTMPAPNLAHSQPLDRDTLADGNDGDVDLMTRISAGDANAFEILVERHQHAVVGTVAKMLGTPNDAEDIAQQVFLRVWKSAPRYQPTAKFTTWLFTITRNLVFNECRRRYRHHEVSMEEREDDHHQQTADESLVRPDDITLQAELQDAIDAAINALPEKQRLALVLRRYEDLPYEEIGKILDLSLPAVKSILFRARAQLKELLKPYLEAGS